MEARSETDGRGLKNGYGSMCIRALTHPEEWRTCQKRNVSEACCTPEPKWFKEASIAKHKKSMILCTLSNDRLGDLLLETVLPEAHAVFEMLQNTNTLSLEACQTAEGPDTLRCLTHGVRITVQ